MPERYDDLVWGEIVLDEPVLEELARSEPVQRLKGIHQAGASFYLLPGRHPITRFEHSLGVMYVLKALNASLEEQVAGLLHDVPHTAFSHTVDIVFPSDEHNFHERFHDRVIMASSIPSILARYGVPLEAATDPESCVLLEKPLPDLCADRIDYSLRGMCALDKISSGEVRDFLGHLLPTSSGIVVNEVRAALWFANLFAEANAILWTGPEEAGAYWALAGAIKRAYALGAFSDDDLFLTDDQAMAKLRATGDPEVEAYLRLLQPGTLFYEVTGEGPSFSTHMKQRVVDPPVLEPGWDHPRSLSNLSPEYAEQLRSLPPNGTIRYKLWSDSIDPSIGGASNTSRGR